MKMKKIIDGKRYDTEKAILIGEATSDNAYPGDFRYWEANLYRTPKSGRYFLAGNGGAMTRFARSCGDGTCGGYGLFPMSPAEALEWAERNLDAETIEEHFADSIEDA
jgi:hypothetical protein